MTKKYLPPVFWAILIFILSAIPGSNYPESVFDYSPLAHIAEFFILSILVLRAFDKINNKSIYLALIICGLYGLSDEIHQIFVINRSFSFLDLLIDIFSIILGIKFWIYLFKSKLQTK